MVVTNMSRERFLGSSIEIADTSAKRRTGLLKHDVLQAGEGLWIAPCEGVHTFGMKFPIDILFLSRGGKVLKISKQVPKRRISICLRAHSVLELPAGAVDASGTQVGDQLALGAHP